MRGGVLPFIVPGLLFIVPCLIVRGQSQIVSSRIRYGTAGIKDPGPAPVGLNLWTSCGESGATGG